MKKTIWIFIFLAGSFFVSMDGSRLQWSRAALASPPSWAPAHGWREKRGDHDDNDEHRHERHERDQIRDIEAEKRHAEDKARSLLGDQFQTAEIFRKLDGDNDRRISRSEFNEGDDFFDRLDLNHDGFLSHGEYDRIDSQRGLISGLVHKVKEKFAKFVDWLF